MFRIFFLSTLFILFFNTAFAADDSVCRPAKVTVQNNTLILPGVENSKTTQIYFLKNVSQQSIWVDHPHTKSMNAGWATYLRPGNWAALSLNRKDFVISCASIQPGQVNALNCSHLLSVCLPQKMQMNPSAKPATFWLAEDKPWDDLLVALKKRG